MTADATGVGKQIKQILLPPNPDRSAAPPPAGSREVRLGGETMGTAWLLAAFVPSSITDADVRAALEKIFANIITGLSQWEAGSAISRFNCAPAGSWHHINRDFARVLDCALNIARASGGAFDPTLGNASELWGFGTAPAPLRRPDDRQAATTRDYSWRDVQTQEFCSRLLQPGGMALDFSGIAKGHAVDAGIEALNRLGIGSALLEIGGELRGCGLRADMMPWWVELETPPESICPATRVGLANWSVATSGSYVRRVRAGTDSWSHTLAADSGLPVDNEVLSVTVFHTGCMQADALATAVLALGETEGLAFADRFGIPARTVTRARVGESAAWKQWSE